MSSAPSVDWAAGQYELTARELEPVAEHVVTLASPSPGDRVLDVACGTGNASLIAARAGTYDEVRARVLAAFRDGNEDPDAFRITSRYLIATITRP